MQFYDISSVYCVVCLPSHVKSPSITIYSPFYSLPPLFHWFLSLAYARTYCLDYYCLFFILFLFLDRGKGREKERERNINVWLPLMHPAPGNPGICSNWELNQRPFGSQSGVLFIEPHQPGHYCLVLKLGKYVLQFCSLSLLFLLFCVPWICIWILGLACQFLQRSHLGLWWELCWMCRSVWEILSS